MLSKIGFKVQEMKDLELKLRNDMQSLAQNDRNDTSLCFLKAKNDLEDTMVVAGEVIKGAASKITDDFQQLRVNVFHEVVLEVELLKSIFDVHSFSMFSYFNSVGNISDLKTELKSDVQAYEHLFEHFVNALFVELKIYNMISDIIFQQTFQALEAGVIEFEQKVATIRQVVTLF